MNHYVAHWPQPCLTQWNYEPCCVGPPKMDGSWWRVLGKRGPTGEDNGKSLQYSCLENPMNSMRRLNDMTLKELPRLVCAPNATGEEWKNKTRKNEKMEQQQKQCPAVDVTGDGSKIWCCKEQYCLGTWNVRPMNEGKLEVVKQEMAREKVDLLWI